MANNEAEKVLSKQIPTANCQCALYSQQKLELSVNLGAQFSDFVRKCSKNESFWLFMVALK